MGQKTSASSRKQPPRAVMSGVAATSIAGSVAFTQQELPEREDDFVDVYLINVNQVILKRMEVGEAIEVQGFQVLTREGVIGEIPHTLRDKINDGNFRRGIVLSVEKPKVRLFNQ